MKLSVFPVILLCSFVMGSLLSPISGLGSDSSSEIQLVALSVFIFVVSYDVGSKMRASSISSIMKQTFILVVSCIAGSAVAGVLFAIAVNYGIKISLAIALGMGWYTFDGPALASYAGVSYGAIAFFSNFFRELLTLLLYLPLSTLAGRIKPIAMGGATTMDTTLTVMRSSKEPIVTSLAFAHGALISFFVPLLVTLALI